MKLAKVIPIYKTGEKDQFMNYRPISILPQFSKLLEKLFTKRLDDFLNKYNILNDSQHGFRKNRAPVLALIELTEEITKNIDERKHPVGIFIDLKKAFDTMDHTILLQKVQKYGIRGVAFSWIESYLKNRKQYVQWEQERSMVDNIICGVPQGSVLGPKLFLLYINDLYLASKKLKFILFADDTTILYSGENLEKLITQITAEMYNLKRWFDKNKLSLNLSKTKFMLFGTRKANMQTQIKIDNVEIERVDEHTFLGVTLDHKLSWKPHITKIKTKTSKIVALMNKSKYFLDKKALYTIYCALIIPHLTYCVETWGNSYKNNTEVLFRVQKKAIRIVHSVGYRDHSNTLFLQSKVLKFKDLVEFKTNVLLFKVKQNLLSTNIHQMFKTREGKHNLRKEMDLKSKYSRTTLKSMCISRRGVELWNSLNNEIKTAESLVKFKALYKDYLLHKYIEIEKTQR